jgi:hypothetical protein
MGEEERETETATSRTQVLSVFERANSISVREMLEVHP